MKKEEREVELKRREEMRLKRRADELAKLKEQHRLLMMKQMQRMTMAQEKEKEELERRITKMQEDDKAMEQRMMIKRREKEELLMEIKRRNEARFRRSRELSQKILEEDLARKSAIEVKCGQAEERLNRLIEAKERQMEAARLGETEKRVQMEERKRKAEELIAARLEEFGKRMEENDVRFEEMKRKQDEELRNRAAFTWLKMRIGEENAQRLQRREQYERMVALRKMEERTRIVEDIIEMKQREFSERSQASAQATVAKQKLIEQAREIMGEGGASLEQLAAKFGVDLDELRRRRKTRQKLDLGNG
jgi:hypothetical protein